jgi:hypothetical protein
LLKSTLIIKPSLRFQRRGRDFRFEVRSVRKNPPGDPCLLAFTSGIPHGSQEKTRVFDPEGTFGLRPVDEPFGHELKAEWLGSSRSSRRQTRRENAAEGERGISGWT